MSIVVVVSFAVGLFVGVVVLWLVGRDRMRSAVQRGRAEGAVARATVDAQLRERNRQMDELQLELQQARGQLSGLSSELTAESSARAASEEAAKRIPVLEQTVSQREHELLRQSDEIQQLMASRAALTTQLDEERKASEEKLALLEEAQQKLGETFKALSADALAKNSSSFLDLAKTSLEKFQEGAKADLETRRTAIADLVKPVRDSLDKVDVKLRELETVRASAYATLGEQVRNMLETQGQLRSETSNLVKALRAPSVRGRWGEMQLKRVVEMAGMLEQCDFVAQESVDTDEGRLRPDLVVKLPGRKNVVVDAKAPLAAYLDSLEASDEETRRLKLSDHARQTRAHVTALSRKAYWQQFDPAPEFVIMFLPGETFFSAALEQDAALIEFGVEQKVILATPTTLIALLRAVAYGWRQERLADNAKAISDLGRELYKRLSDLGGHMTSVGKSLGSAVKHYNQAVGSLEARVLVSARKFEALGAAGEQTMGELAPLESSPRALQAGELVPLTESAGSH